MEFLDNIKRSIEREEEHIEARLGSGIAYDFKKQSKQWKRDLKVLSKLLISINKIENEAVNDLLSEDSVQ